jgi:hypothetical protein
MISLGLCLNLLIIQYSSLENLDPPPRLRDIPLFAKVGTNFADYSGRSAGILRSRTKTTELLVTVFLRQYN